MALSLRLPLPRSSTKRLYTKAISVRPNAQQDEVLQLLYDAEQSCVVREFLAIDTRRQEAQESEEH